MENTVEEKQFQEGYDFKLGAWPPAKEMECVLSEIRSYALREHLSAVQVRQLFNVGIVARGVFLNGRDASQSYP